MKILACETSCDDTSWALVENGMHVLRVTTSSQNDLHAQTGGVVPEVAAREHSAHILRVLSHVMEGYSWDEIDYLAVTVGPGLLGSLLIGIETTKALAYVHKKPILPVHHIEGHIYANWLERQCDDIQFPAVVLTVSGGHNDLYYMPTFGVYELLGSTRDDAAGEAFDKAARMLQLGYPGGPNIEKAALQALTQDNNVVLPRAWMHGTDDFSFSGLKSELKRQVAQSELSDLERMCYASAFQESVIEVLGKKTLLAAERLHARSIIVSGGVSASTYFRTWMLNHLADHGFLEHQLFFPVKKLYSTDNAAMIGSAAYHLLQHGCLLPLKNPEELFTLLPHLSYVLPIRTQAGKEEL